MWIVITYSNDYVHGWFTFNVSSQPTSSHLHPPPTSSHLHPPHTSSHLHPPNTSTHLTPPTSSHLHPHPSTSHLFTPPPSSLHLLHHLPPSYLPPYLPSSPLPSPPLPIHSITQCSQAEIFVGGSTRSRAGGLRNDAPLEYKTEQLTLPPGFQVVFCMNCTPPTMITALALESAWGL